MPVPGFITTVVGVSRARQIPIPDSVALRVVLIDKEEVKISPRTVNVNNVSAARHELTIAGLL